MRRKTRLAVSALMAMVLAVQAQGCAKSDKDLVQGTWEVITISEGGKELPKPPGKELEISLIFKGDKVSQKGMVPGNDEADFTLDSAKSPKHLDIKSPNDKESKKFIYELQGDTLKLATARKGPGDRPTAFTGDDVVVLTLKKKKA